MPAGKRRDAVSAQAKREAAIPPAPAIPSSGRSGRWADLLLLGVAAVWGWTFVLVKEGLEEVPPFTFLFYRFALAWVLLGVLVGPQLRGVGRSGDVWRKGALLGAVLFGGYALQTIGLLYTTATNSGFLTGLSVVLVPVLGAGLFRERVPRAIWAGAVLSVLGLMGIAFGAEVSWGAMPLVEEGIGIPRWNVGDGLTLLCAGAFALQILLLSRYTRPETHVPILMAQVGMVAVLSGAGMLLWEDPSLPSSWQAWKGIVMTGVFATALALWVQTRFQPLSGAGRTAILFSSEPIFAALFGYVLLGERLVGGQWIGAALLLGAILLTQQVSTAPPDPPPPGREGTA